MKVFARFCGHARTNMRKFWSSFFKSLRHQRRVALVALRVRAKCSRTVCTERCKYPVSALAERGCKSARDIGGRHQIYYKLDITKCAIDYALMIVNIPFPLMRNADVNPRGILGDGTEYILILILRNVPSFLLCKAFSLCLLDQRKSVKRSLGSNPSLNNVHSRVARGCRLFFRGGYGIRPYK